MGSDKRSVSTDALETLGTIIGPDEKRDAIHLAVLPVVAVEKMHAGDDVGLVPGGASTRAGNKIGIVDPFLTKPVRKGERFWLVIYPRKINSLRHVWSHPEIDDADESDGKSSVSGLRVAAEQALQVVADDAGLALEELLAGAREYLRSGTYMNQGGRWEGFFVPDDFWDHYQTYTGQKLKTDMTGANFFSCSC